MLIIQLGKSTLLIAETNHKGKQVLIERMRRFSLPEILENGAYTDNSDALAEYISSCLTKGKLSKDKVIIYIGTPTLIHKEYYHKETKPVHLNSLANLEAEAILPEDEANFIIQNQWYGHEKNREGMQTSAVYAVNQSFVESLSKDMKARGLKLIGLYPSLLLYTDIIEKLISAKVSGNEFKDKTLVSINGWEQSIHLAIYHKGQLISQRLDELALDELYRKISMIFQIPFNMAEEYCMKIGINSLIQQGDKNTQAYEEMAEAMYAMVNKLARSVYVMLNEAGLSIDHVIISGTPSAIPGFTELLKQAFEVPCESIEAYRDKLVPVVDMGIEKETLSPHYNTIIYLKGIRDKKYRHLNFLSYGIKQRKSLRRTYLVCSVIFLLMISVMAILPLNYYITSQDYERNMEVMQSSEYKEMQELLDEQRNLRSSLSQIQNEHDRLPFGDSKVAEHLEILQSRLFSGTSVNSMSYASESNIIRVVVTTDDLDKFINAKNQLNQESEYRVSIPVTLNKSNGLWTCEASIELLAGTDEREGNE